MLLGKLDRSTGVGMRPQPCRLTHTSPGTHSTCVLVLRCLEGFYVPLQTR